MTNALVAIHVVISIAGLISGFMILGGLILRARLPYWNFAFLLTTTLTSLTGFILPAPHLLPSHVIGLLSLVVLAVAVIARYRRKLIGKWQTIYAYSAGVALYFNVFVGVVQAFRKIPTLQALAPTQSEPPFAVAQLLVLVVFAIVTVIAARRKPALRTSAVTRPIGMQAQ